MECEESSREAELQKELEKLEPAVKESKLSLWVRQNKALLATGGAIATGAGKAIAWIVEHVEEIQEFVDIASGFFGAESETRTLDFDSLRIGDESLYDALDRDPVITRAVVQRLMKEQGYEDVQSRDIDLIGEGIFP